MARRQALVLREKRKKETATGDSDSDEETQKRKGNNDETVHESEANRTNSKLMERLSRLGTKPMALWSLSSDCVCVTGISSLSDDMEGSNASPTAAIDKVKERIIENDIQGLQTWERVWQCCLGLHGVELVTGYTRFSVHCEGMDLFELFPEPPSISRVKQECEDRRKARTADRKTRTEEVSV